MNIRIRQGLESVWRLMRFVSFYAIAVAGIMYLLPILGLFLESHYDSMSSSVKFFAVIGFFVVVAGWQIGEYRNRARSGIKQRVPSDYSRA